MVQVEDAHAPEEIPEVETFIQGVLSDDASRDDAFGAEAQRPLVDELPERVMGEDVLGPDRRAVGERLGRDLALAGPLEVPGEALFQFPAAASSSSSW